MELLMLLSLAFALISAVIFVCYKVIRWTFRLIGRLLTGESTEEPSRAVTLVELGQELDADAAPFRPSAPYSPVGRPAQLAIRDALWQLEREGKLSPSEYETVVQTLEESWSHQAMPATQSSPRCAKSSDAISETEPRTALALEQPLDAHPPMVSATIVQSEVAEEPPGLAASTVVPHELSEAVDEAPGVKSPSTAETGDGDGTEERRPAGQEVAERARRYAERRAAAVAAAAAAEEVTALSSAVATETPQAPSEAPPPETTHVVWTKWLASFLEERNIRWGELVGGLLIVSCSVALVISFWAAISERPLLKFGLFNGVTAGLVAIGLYAAHRWKLPTTSQGILLTAIMLVPVNFLAIGAFTRTNEQLSAVAIGGELVSVLLFSALVYAACRVVTPSWPLATSIAALVPAVSELAIARAVDGATSGMVFGSFLMLQLGTYTGSQLIGAREALAADATSESMAHQILKRLGIASFALVASSGLLFFQAQRLTERLPALSAWTILLGLPSVLWGVVLWRRPGAVLPNHRLVGSALLALGMTGALVSWTLAWPQPCWLVMQGAIWCVILTVLASALALQDLHTFAATILAFVVVLIVATTAGQLAWTIESAHELHVGLTTGMTGRTLAVFAGLSAVLASVLRRCGPSVAAAGYERATVLCASIGLLIVVRLGLWRAGDPEGLALLLGAYAIGSLVFGLSRRSVVCISLAFGLSWLALAQTCLFGGWNWGSSRAWPLIFLTHGTLVAIIDWAVKSWSPSVAKPFCQVPVINSLWLNSFGALASIVWTATPGDGMLAVQLAWLAALWMLNALPQLHQGAFLAAQLSLLASIGVAIDLLARRQDWYGTWGMLHPHSVQWQAICWSVLATLGLSRRRSLMPDNDTSASLFDGPTGTVARLRKLIEFRRWHVEQALFVLAKLALVLLATYAVLPGIAQELHGTSGARIVPAASQFAMDRIPHEPARQWESWLLLATLLIATTNQRRTAHHRFTPTLWRVLIWTVPLLIAAQFEPDVAVASALRWTIAVYLLGMSAFYWRQDARSEVCLSDAGPNDEATTEEAQRRWQRFAELVSLTALPLLVMLAHIATPGPVGSSFWPILGLLMALAMLLVVAVWLPGQSWSLRDRFRATTSTDSVWSSWIPWAGTAVILLGTLFFIQGVSPIAMTLAKHPIVGPNPGSWLGRLGMPVSLLVPLLLVCVAMIGHAISLRSQLMVLAVGQWLSLSSSAAYLLLVFQASPLLPWTHRTGFENWVRLAQLIATGMSLFGIAWIGATSFYRSAVRSLNVWQATQILFAIAVALLPLLGVTASVFEAPWSARHAWETAGDGWAWLSWAIVGALIVVGRSAASGCWAMGSREATVVVCMVSWIGAMSFHIWSGRQGPGSWWTFHALHLTTFVSATLWTCTDIVRRRLASRSLERPASESISKESATDWSVHVASTLVLLVTLFSLRGMFGDPHAPGWSLTGCAVAILLLIAQGWALAQSGRWLVAWGLVILATNYWWSETGSRWLRTLAPNHDGLQTWLDLNALVTGATIGLWVFLQRSEKNAAARRWRVAEVNLAASLGILSGSVALGQLSVWTTAWIGLDSPLRWWALAATLSGSVISLWGRSAGAAAAACYWAGWLATATLLESLPVDARTLSWLSPMILSAYGLLSSYLWSRREELASLLVRWGAELHVSRVSSRTWIIPANSLLALVVILLGLGVQWTCEQLPIRLAASQAVLAQALAIGLLARGWRATEIRLVALAIAAIGAVSFGWAWLPVDARALDRAVVMLVVGAAITVLYAGLLIKWLRGPNEWTNAARRLVPTLVTLNAICLLFILYTETSQYFLAGAVAMSPVSMFAVVLTLWGLAAACILAACVPGRDPFAWSESQRGRYVYAAELLLGLLFWHLRMSMPMLFGGIFRQYWPLVVLGIAYVVAGLSEYFRRSGKRVLAQPLERTGLALPLLPFIGFWWGANSVHPSFVLLAAGGLYAIHALVRRSFAMGVWAALVTNAALWYFWHHTAELYVWRHPQVWLIPPSLCILVAAYWNRHQLSNRQMSTVRYLCSAIIYASSTTEIVLNGVGQAPWLPVVLAGLSLTGIAAGIWLRTRAFLYLGLSFLLVSLLSVIWYATVDLHQTWLLYVTGIITGVLIIGTFALFERKQQEILERMERLKHWEP